jgi:hypothetical protein
MLRLFEHPPEEISVRRRLPPSVLLALALVAAPLQAREAGHAVTVPMQLELGRPFIDVTLTGPGGKAVPVHAWVDTGGGGVLLSAGLARQLGLKPTGKPLKEEGDELVPVDTPRLRIGGEPIALADIGAFVVKGAPETLNRTDAAMQIPGHLLRGHVVTFDYPARTFTVADEGAAKPQGTPMKAYIGESGMPVVWLAVAGKTEGFLLDTGGRYSMISDTSLRGWMKQHPDWKHVDGTFGPANMLLPHEDRLEMLRIDTMQWGPFAIRNAGAVSRPAGTYERWMSQMLGKPVIGSIGGNVLRDFRVTIDYPAGKVYLQRASAPAPAPLAMVGITLGQADGGGYAVIGTHAGVQGIQAGDRLVRIDGHVVAGVTFDRVVQWLGGKPGDTHALAVLRDGKPATVQATVREVF